MMASAHTHAMISGVRAPAMIWPAIFEGAFSLAKVLFSLMNVRKEPSACWGRRSTTGAFIAET